MSNDDNNDDNNDNNNDNFIKKHPWVIFIFAFIILIISILKPV